eukprot:gene57307-biopygen1487
MFAPLGRTGEGDIFECHQQCNSMGAIDYPDAVLASCEALWRKIAQIEASVSVSERIAVFLSSYEVEEAERVLRSEESAELQPFLPRSLLLAGTDTEEEIVYNKVAPPRGDVSILFTDIVGSTQLWEAAPGRAISLTVLCGMAIHDALVEASWPVVPQFAHVNDKWLVRADAQTGLITWSGICVRIGISHGVVTDEMNPVSQRIDYRGRNVNLASRCESSAPHGSVNISAETYAAVKAELREDGRLQGAEQGD